MAGFGWNRNAGTQTMLSVEATLGEHMSHVLITKTEAGLVIACHLKVPSGRARLVVWTPSRGHLPVSEPVTLEDFNEALKEVTGTDYKLSNPCMLTRFSNESGCATEYRKGCILLAGDAGHRHLPAGGQGLNTGIQETYNLAWKLGAVIRGEAPDSLLITYDSERLPVARSVVDNTTAQSLLFFAHTGPELAIREAMNRLLTVSEANRSLAQQISGFEYSCPESLDMICPNGWEPPATEIAGKRALNVKFRLASKNGDVKYPKDFMRLGKWVQLRFLSKIVSPEADPAFCEWTQAVDFFDILEEQETDTSAYH